MFIEIKIFLLVLVSLLLIYFSVRFFILRNAMLKTADKALLLEAKALHPKNPYTQLKYVKCHSEISEYNRYLCLSRRIVALLSLELVLLTMVFL